jgi:antibiotic biosynthesis monooxygenase (ABM) superfamily enzyme
MAATISATLLVQHRVRASEIGRYEAWRRVILARAAEYPGHQGVHIIRPSPGDNEYSIVIRFATGEDAGRWVASSSFHLRADHRLRLARVCRVGRLLHR